MPPANRWWWAYLIFALALVVAWPPDADKSLAVKFVNWVVDPSGELPVLPDPLALGLGDDPVAVAAHDEQVQRYDALYVKGDGRLTPLKVIFSTVHVEQSPL